MRYIAHAVHMAIVVDATNFLAHSNSLQEVVKSANLLKSLPINALIRGEIGTGKKTLASIILPNAIIVDGQNTQYLNSLIESQEQIIIENFDKVGNYDYLKHLLINNNVRIIGITQKEIKKDIFDKFFTIELFIPPLNERLEDVKPLVEKFVKDISIIFDDMENQDILIESLDLSKNIYSLKKSIFTQYVLKNLTQYDIINYLENFFKNNLEGSNDYRDFLYLYEVPLLKAGLEKFQNQSRLSQVLGLNRNTLRKKLEENKEKLKNE